jgi:hypothetical protein
MMPASKACPSSINSFWLSESASSTIEIPCRSPVPAPGGAVNLLRFDGTVSTLSLPLGNDARGVPLLLRVVRYFPRVFLAADPLLGVALFVLRVFLLFVFAMKAPQAALRSIRCGFGV